MMANLSFLVIYFSYELWPLPVFSSDIIQLNINVGRGLARVAKATHTISRNYFLGKSMFSVWHVSSTAWKTTS